MARKKITEQKIAPEEKIVKLESELELARTRYRQREVTEWGKQKQKEKTFHELKMVIYDLIEIVVNNIDDEKIVNVVNEIKEKTAKFKL